MLADAAELYFIKGIQQAEIAARMKISRSLVSRLISEAQAKGIVNITINRFFQRSPELEEAICSRFGIGEACVLSLPRSMDISEKKRQLGCFAADIIYGSLRSGENLGLTFGTTLQQAVEALSMKLPVNINCVQLTGSLGAADAAFDGHQLVNKLSSAWSCPAVYLHAPLQVNTDDIRRQLFGSSSNRLNAESSRNLDVAVVGLSPLDSGGNSALFTGGHITADDMRLMREHRIVGDIGAYSVDAGGNLVEIDSLVKMIGIDGNEFRTIKTRYGLGLGDHKAGILRAALSGSWFTSVIIDEQTAAEILSE